MSRRFVSLAVLTGLVAVALVSAQPPTSAPRSRHRRRSAAGPATLRPSHPRLLVLDADLTGVRRRLQKTSASGGGAMRLRRRPAACSTSRSSSGRWWAQLLAQSRVALDSITTLAGLFLLEGDRRMLARATAEMRAVAAFSDWNPSHFLDVAEMTAAMALGYDWLYSDLTAEERKLFRTAIVNKGLAPGYEAIRMPRSGRPRGATPGARSASAGSRSARWPSPSTRRAWPPRCWAPSRRRPFRAHLGRFAPDGGDVDGPGYWGYSTKYSRGCWRRSTPPWATTSVSDGSTGCRRPGSSGCTRSGRAAGSSTTRMPSRARAAPQMFWMAGRYDRPEYAAHERLVAGRVPRPRLPPALERASSGARGLAASDSRVSGHRRRGAPR